MNVEQAYNQWAAQYDTNENKTRDLEKKVLRDTLSNLSFQKILEIGCGTGKNTEWLIQKAASVTSVDFSEEMLAKAKEKIKNNNVRFQQADITQPWSFAEGLYDLVSFSLVLEHIKDLGFIFQQINKVLQTGGHVYIGELHPFKQYAGSKARFTDGETEIVTDCYTHHISEFIQTAKKNGLVPVDVNEYFDDDDTNGMPRILCLILQKS
ncbi:MAG TPA: class I SAM-dependent methyltransferase [Chitinophagaceae bacterium]|jgi:ubiquinone/menaquinone biosynthesis C-methylase UbiE|nr:class I SAM-dependent methyltransferase [Chitinophagaceae bacterium]